MGSRRSVIIVPVAAGVLALTACVGGPPSPEQIAGEFARPIEPAWEVEVPGLYGDLAVRDGVVLAYAVDEEVGLRLTAHAAEDGELLWEHTASPGGAPANPLLSGVRSASRPYPIPTIAPLVVDVGEGDETAPAVVFFERDTAGSGYVGDDFLRVADLRTGELLEVTAPDVDPDEFSFDPLRRNDDGELVANTRTIGYPCGERAVCFVTEDADVFDGYGTIRLDTETLEARYSGGHIPEPADGVTVIPEWGLEYARVITDADVSIARYRDGVELWSVGVEELFGVPRTSPPDEVDFVELGGLVLIQGYQPLLESLARDQPHTLSIDYVESRTLVAVDAESGEVAWRLPGGDLLCHAVRGRPIPADAETVPVCVANGGGYVYDIEEDSYLEQDDFDVAVAELSVADGELGWSVEGAGDVSVAHVVRLLWVAYAARGDLTVVEVHDSSDAGVLDLRDGAWHPIEGEDLFFACKEERDDVELEFEGSVFAGGGNAITTGYPAGWQHFPCDFEGRAADTWTTGGVRLAGVPAGENLVVLPLEGSLAGFRL